MAESGFCADGDQEKLLADGATEIGGPLPVNTDGGLIANGEPIGASGLRQIHELVLQLRGAGRRPPGARRTRVGFAQLYGAPGTAGATIVTPRTTDEDREHCSSRSARGSRLVEFHSRPAELDECHEAFFGGE